MILTFDTSHSPIGPCRSLEQSPSAENSRHVTTAVLSSSSFGSENAGLGGGETVGVTCNVLIIERKYGGRLRVKLILY